MHTHNKPSSCCEKQQTKKHNSVETTESCCAKEVIPEKTTSCCAAEIKPASSCCESHGTHKKAPISNNPNAVYLCPMHLEIRQIGQGSCPICGMALEPEVASLDDAPNIELIDMTRRFWIALALTLPVFMLEMGSHLFHIGHIIPAHLSAYVQMLFALPVVLWAGLPFFIRGAQSIKTGHLNMFTLVAAGTAAATLYSFVATIAPQIFPSAFWQADGSVAVYFESAAVIIVLVLLGQVLELRAREKTGNAIRALLQLTPKTAIKLLDDGSEIDVAVSDIQVGDLLRIHPGETIPVDAKVIDGRSNVDESMLTGEAMPVSKIKNSSLIGGTLNQSGSLLIEAEKVGSDTLLARIVQYVADAQRSRAPIQRIVDTVSAWFVPAVLLTAVAAFISWYLLGPEPRLSHALIAAVSVLIIACPCALGLATPMSIMVGIGRGAQSGILVRNAEALEQMQKIDTVVIDKTGTLTEGKPSLSHITAHGNLHERELLALAASVEQLSEHPLAQAIVRYAKEHKIALYPCTDFDAPSGKGAQALVNGQVIALGNRYFMDELNIDVSELEEKACILRRTGASVVFMAVAGKVEGLLAISDPIKTSAANAIAALQKKGLRIVMLTGDNRVTAQSVADKLAIDEVFADVLPMDKSAVVKRLQSEGLRVAMVGDGTNDAPALVQADIGIAMGNGTDVAMESADITLLKGDLNGLVQAHKLSEQVMNNIRQNLFFAFIYNALGVPLAAGILYPWLGITLSPMVAAAAMSLSSVSVIGNALRMRFYKL